jgi:hypothetical protein
MANYPFRINIKTKLGSPIAFATSSFATEADTLVSASAMVDRINGMISASHQDGTGSGSAQYNNAEYTFGTSHTHGFPVNIHLSASYITDENTGSVVFTDKESPTDNGLDYYTFWGSRVCTVLGLPEGIPIYTENFKLSDDSSNPDNYLSGDVIASGVSIKEKFKMAPQARMRSNLVWDHQFGEGFLQWVSGSASKLLIGYDDQADTYSLSAASTATFNITGVTTASISRLEVDSGTNGNNDILFRGITGPTTNNADFWMPHEVHCGFNFSSAAGVQVVVPLNGILTEHTATTNYTEYQTLIMPFDCIWAKVFVRSEGTPGVTWVNMHIVADGTEGESLGGGSNTEGDAVATLNMTSANTVYSVGAIATSGGSVLVAKGETIIFTFDPTADSNDTVMTFLFMMDPTTALF